MGIRWGIGYRAIVARKGGNMAKLRGVLARKCRKLAKSVNMLAKQKCIISGKHLECSAAAAAAAASVTQTVNNNTIALMKSSSKADILHRGLGTNHFGVAPVCGHCPLVHTHTIKDI